jgi:hypothetical protein
MERKQRWSDLSPGMQRGVVVAGAIEVGLAAAAWIDLARRPSAQVNGPKPAWAAAIAVNVIGPLSYFRWGRRRSA